MIEEILKISEFCEQNRPKILSVPIRNIKLLTENEVSRTWSRLFKDGLTEDAFGNAENLLSELRPESPLRHRLEVELKELRKMQSSSNAKKVKA